VAWPFLLFFCFSFFCKFLFANLPCTSFVYLMLSLSHTRSRSLYGSLCSLALVLRSRSFAHVKIYSFIPIFFSCSCCKTKIQHISFVAFSFRYNFIEFKCIKNWKLPSVSWLHLKSVLKNATNRCERQSKENPQTTKIVCARLCKV